MSFYDSVLLLIAMMIGVMLPRVLPMALLAKRNIAKNIQIWLSFVPVAILSALLAPEIFMKNESLWLAKENLFLLAFIPVVIVAYFSKNLFVTLLVGMVLVAGMRYFSVA